MCGDVYARHHDLVNCVPDLKEIKSAFDVFNMSSEEKNELSDNRKKEEATEEFKLKDRPFYKESRSTRDETDTWAYIAEEGEREVTEDSSGK